jgi:endonuclease YncB( thermonuclease family)
VRLATVTTFGSYPARVLDWHDGDTAHLNLDLGFGIILSAYSVTGHPVISCRIFGINAPELNTVEGLASLAYAAQLCPPGTQVSVISHSWDKYGGRFDGEIILPDGRSFGQAMIDAGQALPYG